MAVAVMLSRVVGFGNLYVKSLVEFAISLALYEAVFLAGKGWKAWRGR